jgi:hypothetical protein
MSENLVLFEANQRRLEKIRRELRRLEVQSWRKRVLIPIFLRFIRWIDRLQHRAKR